MLTDEQIEQIIFRYTSRQDAFNLSIIKIIMGRLVKLADFDALHTLDSATEITDISKMYDLHSKYVKEQKKRLKEDLWWIAVVIYLESLKFYEEQLELEMNKALMNAITEFTKKAQKSLEQILATPVFVIRDLKNPTTLKAYNLEKTYRTVIQEARTYNDLSKDLRDIALKRTETQVFDSGVRYMINNPSNKIASPQSANNAIRYNVLDSVRSFINELQDIMGDQFGADAVELSAHIYPAPDHAPAQGHQFSLEEVSKMQAGEDFKDLNGTSYVGFERNIGEWNCRHYFMKIKAGEAPTYTQKQLDKILADNARGYTDPNGKHYTLYECTQVQRKYEREIRHAKEKYIYGQVLNDKSMMANARTRVGKLTAQYKQFSRMCNIPANLERTKVKYYN